MIYRDTFSLCQRYNVESICATGYLESMLTPEGKVTGDEIYDMEQSVLTGPDHLMLSGESTIMVRKRQNASCSNPHISTLWIKSSHKELSPQRNTDSRPVRTFVYTLVMFDSRRIRHLNQTSYTSWDILYWTEWALRTEWNCGLAYAKVNTLMRKTKLISLITIDSEYQHENIRQLIFLIESVSELCES